MRPIGLRFSPTDSIHIVFDPLSVAVTAPAIEPDDDYPTLRKVQRRTSVGVEATFE